MSGERGRPGGTMPALTHQQAEELISDRIDGPLDVADERTLAAHLAGCPSCTHFAAQMGVMGDGLRELPRLPASPTVARQVRERIQQPATLWDRLGRIFSGQLGLAPVAATAALLVAVVTGAIILNQDGDGTGDDNPTVLASTQISIDRTLTSTRAVADGDTPVPGQVFPTATLKPGIAPMIRAEPTSTAATIPAATETTVPTATPSETPVPTATETTAPAPADVATDVPTNTPVPPTASATPLPPTASATPPSPTATRVPRTATPTKEPTEVPTDVPTATEEPADTPEPTETATPVPTDAPTERPTRTATAEPEPTETPTAEAATATPEPEPTNVGQPTIAPTDGTVVGADVEAPVVQPTAEPLVDQPTETPPDDPVGSDSEPTIAPIDAPTVAEDPAQTPEGGTGGPIVETGTEGTVAGDETPDPAIETPDDGGEPGTDAILDNTSRIAGLDGGSGAPIGQLPFSPDGTLMVVSDASGTSLRVAEVQTGVTVLELGAGQYPEWSPLGGILMFNDTSAGSTANAWFRDANDFFSFSDSDVEEGGYADVPAGWFDATAYYLRIYETGRISLRGYDAGSEAGRSIGEVWGLDDAALSGVRPLQTSAGFLIPTAYRWLLVTPDGGAREVGGNALGSVGDGLLSPDGSLLAISGSAGLYIVEAGEPGTVVGQVPYRETAGAGFSWSPDSRYVAVSDGSSISVYTAAGDPVGAATSETGVTIAGPQFQDGVIYFVQTSGEPSLRRFDLKRLLP